MNKFNKIKFVVIILILAGCSAPSQFGSNYELTSERISIGQGELSVAVPAGFVAPLDSHLDQFEFWLINKDLNSTIALNKINIDHVTVRSIYNNRLSTLVKYSKVLRKAQFGKEYQTVGKDEYFNLNNIQCAAFQLSVKGSVAERVIVFQHENNYYELIALASSKSKNSQILEDLYNAQNTILTSIR